MYGICGGFVGFEVGTIEASFATGSVRCKRGCTLGGLVGQTYGAAISDSYASGDVSANHQFTIGGLIGDEVMHSDYVARSYSMGAVSAASCRRDVVGGFIGSRDDRNHNALDAYWDTTTSGTNDGVGFGKQLGITGLTTTQFQSGLPTRFDPKIWAENPNINNGLPYLIANPPPNLRVAHSGTTQSVRLAERL